LPGSTCDFYDRAFPLLAVLLGFLLFWGPSSGFQTDETFARYGAIAVLAGLDTVLGGLRAWGRRCL
jgi:small basic protein